MKKIDLFGNSPAPFQAEILRHFYRRSSSVDAVKRRAAATLSELPKHTRCFYSEGDVLLASFRYLDADDYARFPMLKGYFNAVVTPANGKPAYLHKIINFRALQPLQQ